MAGSKISDLTLLAGASITTADVLSIVDVSANETKKTTVADLMTALGTVFQPRDAGLTAMSGQDITANSLLIGTGDNVVTSVTFATNTFPARASTGGLVDKPITDFALSLLDDSTAALARTTLGAGTSSFSGAFVDLSGKPTTLVGYGITDAQPIDAALTALAAGSDFVRFTGPTTSVKVFTLPDSSQTLLYSGGPLGTPASGVATNLTGTASGLTAGSATLASTVTTNANLTGPITSVGNATSIASQTGTGTTFAMSAGPTFTGPVTVKGPGGVNYLGADLIVSNSTTPAKGVYFQYDLTNNVGCIQVAHSGVGYFPLVIQGEGAPVCIGGLPGGSSAPFEVVTAAGKSLIVRDNAGTSEILAANNPFSVYLPLKVGGSTLAFQIGGVDAVTVDASQQTTFASLVNTKAVQVTGSTGIPANAGLGYLLMASGFGSPNCGRIYVGDGTGWHLQFAKRSGSVDTSIFDIADNGSIIATQMAATFGAPTALTVVGAAHTNLTTGTEDIGVRFNMSASKQFAAGAKTTQREVVFDAPTYTATSATTIDLSATVAITGSPIASTNITETNPVGLLIGTPGTSIGVLCLAGNTSGYVNVRPAAAAGSWTLTLPPDDGTSGQFLRTDGNGVCTWVTASGSGDALTSGTLDQFADVTQASGKTLAITENTTLAGGTHSGTNTGDQSSVTGNAGTATALATVRTIGGSNFDGSANVTTFPSPGAIGGTTPAAGTFTTLVAGSTTSLLLGTAGSAVGNIGFRNATSGTATLVPPTGALGTYSVTLPNAASTLPIFGQQVTFAGPTAARTYTFPDANSTLATLAGTETLTGKRITKRSLVLSNPGATPTINTDLYDVVDIEGQTADITSLTTNLTGTPSRGDMLRIAVTGTASRAITPGGSFEDGAATMSGLTTSGTTRLDMVFYWNTATSKWRLMSKG